CSSTCSASVFSLCSILSSLTHLLCFFTAPPPPELYTLSLHDALPIFPAPAIINSGPSVCLTAACCSLFNPFNNSSIVLLNQSHHLNLIFLLLLSLFLMHLLSLYKYYYRQ